MGDENHRVVREFIAQPFHQKDLRFRIKGRTELIKEKDAAWAEKCTGYKEF